MKKTILSSLIPIYLGIVLLFPQSLFSQQTVTGSIMHDGKARDYRLFIPAGYSPDEAMPLVFNLHGFSSNAFQQQLYSIMELVADTAGFLVCFPNGVDNAWNVGWSFGSTEDDVGFISSLLDELIANYAVDTTRVYSCGMSNGGFMSYRLACELNDRIAAIASVTGSITPEYFPLCNPGRSVPVMEIHGTADLVVPYSGSGNLSIHIDTVIQFWVENDQCDLNPTITELPNTNLLDGSTVTRTDYSNCQDNAMVSLLKVNLGGHTWPGAAVEIPINGLTNQDISASEEIWKFFKQFQLKNAVTSLDEEIVKVGNLTVYPNPSNHTLQVKNDGEEIFESYEIYSSNGQRITGGSFENKSKSIDISQLKPGAYILLIANPIKRDRSLFIKN